MRTNKKYIGSTSTNDYRKKNKNWHVVPSQVRLIQIHIQQTHTQIREL